MHVTTSAETPLPVKKLLIADDHRLVRAGLRAQLEGEPDLTVVAEAENGQEALELSRRLVPDLILMDVRMPVMNGLEATRAIKEELPEVSILIVTTHESQEYLLEAIRAGAAGYILKEATKQELLEAVREVLEGELPLDGPLAARLLKRLAEETQQQPTEPSDAPRSAAPTVKTHAGEGAKPPREALSEVLTPREIEILRLVAAGRTNREIAKELVISLTTVKTHMQRIIPKLGASDRTQAAVKAIELGLYSE
jgi:DNA-binding NarL/FixJ family response regulator